MELTVGTVLEGKVKTITNYGAFIALPENMTGMVHISEVANAFVSDIRQHLTEGQDVKVMVISLDNGKINLSIRRTQPAPQRQPVDRPRQGFDRPRTENRPPRPQQQDNRQPRPARPPQPVEKQPQSFDDMLKQFMADSDSKISGLKQYDRKTKTRRR